MYEARWKVEKFVINIDSWLIHFMSKFIFHLFFTNCVLIFSIKLWKELSFQFYFDQLEPQKFVTQLQLGGVHTKSY